MNSTRFRRIRGVALGFLAAAVLASSPPNSLAQDQQFDIDRFFEGIQEARKGFNYQAEQTIFATALPTSIVARFKVISAFPFKRRERIDGEAEDRVVLLEDGKYLWNYLPKRKLVVKKPLGNETDDFVPSFNENVDLIKKNYQVVSKGEVLSGSVTCHILEFQPRHHDRLRREVWFDRDRKLPVRIYVYTREGRPAYVSELDNIKWNPELGRDAFHLKVPQGTRVYEIAERSHLSLDQARALMQQPIVLPSRVPSGFFPVNIVLRVEGTQKKVQIVYSDGLSRFSVFQEPIPPRSGGLKTSPQAPPSGLVPGDGGLLISQYGPYKVVSYELQNVRATVVGDISESDLVDTARSFSPSK